MPLIVLILIVCKTLKKTLSFCNKCRQIIPIKSTSNLLKKKILTNKICYEMLHFFMVPVRLNKNVINWKYYLSRNASTKYLLYGSI